MTLQPARSSRPGTMTGRPMQLVEYACGHSSPVRGAGGKSAAICQACLAGYRKLTGLRSSALTVARMMGRHPDAYCSCEICQTTIP